MTTKPNKLNQSSKPALYSIQYPNCRNGVFSLRQPFKDMSPIFIPNQIPDKASKSLTPSGPRSASDFNRDRVSSKTRPMRNISKRNAQIQCSLLLPNIRHEMGIQANIDGKEKRLIDQSDDNDVKYRYRSQRRSPVEYELWEVESPRTLDLVEIDDDRRYQRSIGRTNRNRRAIIEYDDNDGSDEDWGRVVYARSNQNAVRKSYIPSNVRMICIREDETTN